MQNLIFFINEHLMLSIIWTFFLILIIMITVKDLCSKSKIINNFQAINLINKKSALVIDTRSLECFKKGHIVNSINIPLKNIFLGKISEIKLYSSFPVILILNSSHVDKKCITEFLNYGFNKIFILKNGIYNWNLEHLPLVIKS